MRLSPLQVLRDLRTMVGQLQQSISDLDERLQSLERRISAASDETFLKSAHNTEKRLGEAQEAIINFTVTRIDEVQAGINSLLEARSSEISTELIDRMEIRVVSTEQSLLKVIAELQERSSVASGELRRAILAVQRSQPVAHSQVAEEIVGRSPSSVDDAIYSMLEDRFRGAPEEIKERQESYISTICDKVSDEHPLLDIGCGRGEWLSLLSERAIPARGVDSNSTFVEECIAQGLDVRQGSAPECMASIPDASLGAVTMFQVVEHLEFSTILEVFQETRRVLQPGGILLVEFPNIKTLMVGATTFWIDPTHVRPLHPQVVEFLAELAGFTRTSTLYSRPALSVPDLPQADSATREFIHQIADILGGAGDVAVVATA